MSRPLASDWADWASDCEARETVPDATPATEFELTFTDHFGQVLDSARVDLATGNALLADVVPMFG